MSPTAKPELRVYGAEVALADRDDDALMLLSAAGLAEAFAVLVRRHLRAVRGYCIRICGDAAAGDDMAQEVFVTAWQRRRDFEARGRFKSYLFAIALSRSKNELRARRRRTELPLKLSEADAPDSEQLDELVATERQRRLHAYVQRLPKAQRQAIQLRYAADLEYSEIAEILSKPEATVRSRVFLGIARLKQLIGKRGQP